MLLAPVGMSVLSMTVIVAPCARAVGVHAGGIQAGRSGVRVGVIAIVTVVAFSVAVLAPLGV
jgi:predicted hotdog family 3-hydroxylacyl-ACP dehydratase